MTSMAKVRGRDVHYCLWILQWVFTDTREPIMDNKNRTCAYCKKPPTKEGHDFCLGALPGVSNACCGHGNTNEAYIKFNDGKVVRGDDAIEVVEVFKKVGIA